MDTAGLQRPPPLHGSGDFSSDSDGEMTSEEEEFESDYSDYYKSTPPLRQRHARLNALNHKSGREGRRPATATGAGGGGAAAATGSGKGARGKGAMSPSPALDFGGRRRFPSGERDDSGAGYELKKKQLSMARSVDRDRKQLGHGDLERDQGSASSPASSPPPTPATTTQPPALPGPANIPNVDLPKPFLSLGSSKLAAPRPSLVLRPQRQSSRTDMPADRLRFFETLKLLLMLNKRKEKDPVTPGRLPGTSPAGPGGASVAGAAGVGLLSGPPSSATSSAGGPQLLWQNQWNELIWLELQAWHANRSMTEQDMYLYTARHAIPEVMQDVLHFRVAPRHVSCQPPPPGGRPEAAATPGGGGIAEEGFSAARDQSLPETGAGRAGTDAEAEARRRSAMAQSGDAASGRRRQQQQRGTRTMAATERGGDDGSGGLGSDAGISQSAPGRLAVPPTASGDGEGTEAAEAAPARRPRESPPTLVSEAEEERPQPPPQPPPPPLPKPPPASLSASPPPPHAVCSLHHGAGDGPRCSLGFRLIEPAHLELQKEACQQVKALLEQLDSLEALFPSLHALQREFPRYAAADFQRRVKALCLWLNVTRDLNHKLGLMGTILAIRDVPGMEWPVFEVTSPHWASGGGGGGAARHAASDDGGASSGSETDDEEEEEMVVVEEVEVDGDVATRGGASAAPRCAAAAIAAGTRPHVRFQESFFRGGRADSEGEESPGTPDTEGSSEGSRPPPAARHTAIYRPFVDKALKQMGLRKLIMRLHRLLDGSLRRARDALMPEVHGEQESELALGGSSQDYLPELLERLTLQECAAAPPGEGGEGEEGEEGEGGGEAGRQLLAELERMGLPSFRPAYLVLCRILLNVIHECLKLRLEQRPAGEPSLLSVKQLVRECKEVIKGGLIVKQYYQLMTHSVLEGEQPEPEQDIDEFEDDLQKMLTVYYEYIQSWISMLQHLPQASYGLKNLLEEEWGFSKQVVPLVRGGEAQAGTLFCDIARELLHSTGEFLRDGARRLCSELHVSPNDSVQSDGIRRSVIETCRAVKELFHEARERASKALGFAKMLKKDLGLAAEFVLSSSVDELLHLLATSGHVKVLLEDLEPVQVFVPAPLGEHRPLVLQLLSAACGRDCSGLEAPAAAGGYLLLLQPRGGGAGGGAAPAGPRHHEQQQEQQEQQEKEQHRGERQQQCGQQRRQQPGHGNGSGGVEEPGTGGEDFLAAYDESDEGEADGGDGGDGCEEERRDRGEEVRRLEEERGQRKEEGDRTEEGMRLGEEARTRRREEGSAGAEGGSPGAEGGSAGAEGGSPGAEGGSAGAEGGSAGAEAGSTGAEGGSAGAEEGTAGAEGGSPGAEGRSLGAEEGSSGAEGGSAGAEEGSPGAEEGNAGAEGGSAGAEGGSLGAEEGTAGAEGGSPGAEGRSLGAEEGSSGAEGGSAGAEEGSPGAEEGNAGAEGGSPGAEEGSSEPSGVVEEPSGVGPRGGEAGGGGGSGRAEWCGRTMRVSLTTETINTLLDVQVCSLLLVALHSGVLQEQRKAFQRVACYAVRLHSEQTSTRPAIAHALEALKVEALGLCDTISGSIEEVNARFVQEAEGDMEEVERYSMQQYYKETMIQAFNFGFEYHKEVVRLMSGESRQRVGDHFISFARKWMEYVLSKCESGRGTRPRWATQGFEFITAIEPAFISALPEEDFVSLQTLINSCILHVIGKPHSPGVAIHRNSPRPISVPRCHSDPPVFSVSVPISSSQDPIRVLSLSEGDRLSSLTCEPFKSLSRHSSPTEEREEPSFPRGEPLVVAASTPVRRSWELTGFVNEAKEESSRCGRMERVRKAMARFEQKLDAQSQRRRVVGRVCSTPHAINNLMHVGLRKVTFKWQRGNKIGEGQYGKVYTCVNVDTGELMAMKEIRFQPNDHKTIKETADEIKIFEGINHSNLVRYYGVELHREEMYIFMEYCDEGTLEEVSRLGLQEPVIRHYTKQICTAITELHERGIVHRDIKGANIFLTSTGHIKLGDFGCSVKLKNISQTMPGEVNSTLGTAAYMAPEVITRARGEGHGRAADIWSLGCVLIEMATGKRPWHEYEHNFQIMYRVGMGHKPPLPERLSPEGRDFLALCLESDPSDRCTASQLLDHAFVKVCLDQDEI